MKTTGIDGEVDSLALSGDPSVRVSKFPGGSCGRDGGRGMENGVKKTPVSVLEGFDTLVGFVFLCFCSYLCTWNRLQLIMQVLQFFSMVQYIVHSTISYSEIGEVLHHFRSVLQANRFNSSPVRGIRFLQPAPVLCYIERRVKAGEMTSPAATLRLIVEIVISAEPLTCPRHVVHDDPSVPEP